MEYLPWNFLVYVVIPSLLFLLIRWRSNSGGEQAFPPGPPGWPILGNMLDLGAMPHKTLTELRHRFGSVLWLRLGVRNTMVIQSAKAATEFFKNHDLTFVERNINIGARVHDYHKGSLALAPYGTQWRVLRRLVTVDMLTNKRINETASIRRKCVENMQKWIEEEATKLEENGSSSEGVHVARFVFLMTFNLLGNLMLSRDLVDPNSKEGLEFFDAMRGLMETNGHGNIADYFPWLRWLDPQGVKRRMKKHVGKALEIASCFVKARMKERKLVGGEKTKDFLDVLLDFEDNENDESAKISDHHLNIFILEIFMAGSETTSSTTEWALTELLCNPETLNKAKSELNRVIGPNRKIEESDVDNLPYLQCIIKETFRLHPPIPFLVPRKAVQDTKFMGYFVPKDTQVFVNAYAIGRDPEVWTDEPESFKPERFIGSKIDYKGQHYELIPFGAGRRMCAGVPLGHRMLHLTLGSLLHQFDWALGRNVSKESMNWNDNLGITMRKSEPLLAVPTKCLP
ncbi:PREDICTED: cytochrome P450 76A2-like [Fragaria vesca subsp. vesca]|uniref:cytochrome P450 76A2-like n=1 Tax=Fragaria vesca subsp. vesca TaxID=101020 RepID=UPI0002C2F5AA|nr:PREDICTED: cytochrome P450 76A2-like [Fragaria vesca subsp. vesca]